MSQKPLPWQPGSLGSLGLQEKYLCPTQWLFNLVFFFLQNVYLFYVCQRLASMRAVYHVHAWCLWRWGDGISFPVNGTTDKCEPLWRCWESNLGPLNRWLVLQPPYQVFKKIIFPPDSKIVIEILLNKSQYKEESKFTYTALFFTAESYHLHTVIKMLREHFFFFPFSLCGPGWSWTCTLPVSASQVLGLQTYVTTPNSNFSGLCPCPLPCTQGPNSGPQGC